MQKRQIFRRIVSIQPIVGAETSKAVNPQCTEYRRIFDEFSKKANMEFAKNAIYGLAKPKAKTKYNSYAIMELMMK